MADGPDFGRLLKVLWREQPDRVPFYEHLFDTAVIEIIMGKPVPSYQETSANDEASRGHRLKSKKAYVSYLAQFCK
jgi:hypothetical protein